MKITDPHQTAAGPQRKCVGAARTPATSDLIFGCRIIIYLSEVRTLLPAMCDFRRELPEAPWGWMKPPQYLNPEIVVELFVDGLESPTEGLLLPSELATRKSCWN